MTTGDSHGPWRVFVVEDDPLVAALVGDGLRSFGHTVLRASDPVPARHLIPQFDPHVIVCDLHFTSGESGAHLITEIRQARPWVAVVVLTNHQSPELAVSDSDSLPPDAVYMVKSAVSSVAQLHDGVVAAMLGGEPAPGGDSATAAGVVVVTPAHAEALRLLAAGASTRGLAKERGTSIRAVESLLVRLYRALGIDLSTETNPRVAAIRLWQSGRVRVARGAAQERSVS